MELLLLVHMIVMLSTHPPGIPDSNGHSDDEEEEAWLDALEAGQVDERGYLPKKKEQGTLTARQVCAGVGRGKGGKEV